MRVINWIALILVVIGALNWGMIGFFNIDVIGSIFGGQNTVGARIIYAIVGLAGLWCISLFRWLCCCGSYKNWKEGCVTNCDPHHKDHNNGDRCCR